MREICQSHLPLKPWMAENTRRLPGLNPLVPGDWLWVDDVYRAQMARREELLAEKRNQVYRMSPGAVPAAAELLARILTELDGRPGFSRKTGALGRPDGRRVRLDGPDPLIVAASLVQEDLVILEKRGDQHVLTGAVLCFPASWSLDDKFDHDLTDIHAPVARYTDDVGRRVQRVFDLIRPENPMWRANHLIYSDPELFQPRRTSDRRSVDPDGPLWARVERQCLLRLPKTGAVVFSIHTFVVPLSKLSEAERAALLAANR